tara:strand:- start:6017 stop:7591 length:1575 start_codon:yes stop_codon:yes gene_type:complete
MAFEPNQNSVQYGPWAQGVRYDLPPEDITANGLSAMEGTRLTAAASVEASLGTKSYKAEGAIAATPTVTVCGDFQIPGGASKVFLAAGNKFFEYSSGWVDRSGSETLTAGNDNTWEWAKAYNNLVLTNGVDTNAIKWSGTGNASTLDDNARFTKGKHIAFWDNRLWIGNENSNNDRVWRSDAGDIETWQSTAFYNLGSPVTALVPMQNALAIHTEDFISVLIPTGNATVPYQLQQRTNADPLNPQRGGTISARAVVSVPGMGQIYPLDDGFWLWNGGDLVSKVSHALDIGYWDNIVTSRLFQSFGVYYAAQNEVWFWLPYGNDQVNMNHIMIMSTKHRYQDAATGDVRNAWMGPQTGNTAIFERNCAAIIANVPHAGDFGGTLLDHRPDNVFNQETLAYVKTFTTASPPPAGGDTELCWLSHRTYYDALGGYELSVVQESEGMGTNTTTFSTTGGGAALGAFVLNTNTLGSKRMVSKGGELIGYDPSSTLQFTNNNANENFRIRRTHLHFEVTGQPQKASAGEL